MSVVVRMEGLDRWKKAVSPVRYDVALQRGLDRAGSLLRDMTKQLPAVSAKNGYGSIGIPVDTGRMRQMIRKERVMNYAVGIVADVRYSGYVHDGTSRMPARPFFQWVMDRGGEERAKAIVIEEFKRAAYE